MKRLLWIAAMLFVLTSGSALADSIIGFIPNDGSGDNFGYIDRGSGFTVGIGGGVAYDFFNFGPYAPGSTLGGFTDLFVSGGSLQVGGNTYDLFPLSLGALFMSTITLPTNGRDVTIPVSIGFSVAMENVELNEEVDVGDGASGKITFHYFDGSYYADSRGFTTVPEPATVAFMATGIAGMLAAARKRRRVSKI